MVLGFCVSLYMVWQYQGLIQFFCYSFKKSSNGQGGRPRTNAVGANSEPNVQRAHPQNGANVQPILNGTCFRLQTFGHSFI